MKKLKRDLTKPEKVEVKKTAEVNKKAVKHQDEYPDGPDFEWADYWFEGEPDPELVKGGDLTRMPKTGEVIKPKVKPVNVELRKIVVDKGDNLTKISKKFGVSVDKLIELNGIKNPNKLKIGEVIKLKEDNPNRRSFNLGEDSLIKSVIK